MKSRNQSVDMTQGVIWKQLAYFALPLFLGNLCQQLYNTADSVIVGKFVGKDALAAVSSSGNLIFMMTGFFMGLFVGAGVIISRYFGAKCYDRLEAAVHTDLAFAMVCGVLLTLVGIFLTPQILVWMRTPEDVLPGIRIAGAAVFVSRAHDVVIVRLDGGRREDDDHPARAADGGVHPQGRGGCAHLRQKD